MGSWIALIGSSVIGGLVLLSFLNFNNDLTREMYLDTLDNAAYDNLTEVALIIESDFAQIGLGINHSDQDVFISADSTDIRYYVDLNNDGALDSMRYYLGNTSSASPTENPRDKILYRVVNNGSAEGISMGLTDFEIHYHDALGYEIPNYQPASLRQVRTIVISLAVESTIIYDDQYSQKVWQCTITPPNLVAH